MANPVKFKKIFCIYSGGEEHNNLAKNYLNTIIIIKMISWKFAEKS